ncbi:putative transporter MCH2 [Yarrowia sp. C11]|nr:putative transporter MCH2 [Yarrowia sp. C11]KAG5364015.1 putative transporter MCH2 [Yarrowia sp. E02]
MSSSSSIAGISVKSVGDNKHEVVFSGDVVDDDVVLPTISNQLDRVMSVMSEKFPEKGPEGAEEKPAAPPSPFPPGFRPPPDGGYGWVSVGCAMAINATSWGVNSSFAVFLAHYLRYQTFARATATDYAFVGGLALGTGFLFAPLYIKVTQYVDLRILLFIGACMQTGSQVSASFAKEIWHLYLSQGLLQGLALCVLFVPTINIVPMWFLKKRSLANGLSVAGSGVGGVLFILTTQRWINIWGLEWAFRATGIMTFVINTCAAILIREPNPGFKMKFPCFNWKLFFHYECALIFAWGFFSLAGYIVMLYSVSASGLAIGLTNDQATNISAIMSGSMAIGRPLVGYLSDKFGRINMTLIAAALIVIFDLCIWLPATSYGVYIFYAVFNGLIVGTVWVAVGPIGAEVGGLQLLPTLAGMIFTVFSIPAFFSEVIALKIRRHNPTKPFVWTQVFAAFAFIFSAICLLFLREVRVRKALAKQREESADTTPMPTFWQRFCSLGKY